MLLSAERTVGDGGGENALGLAILWLWLTVYVRLQLTDNFSFPVGIDERSYSASTSTLSVWSRVDNQLATKVSECEFAFTKPVLECIVQARTTIYNTDR